jgi:dihydrofolate reductase
MIRALESITVDGVLQGPGRADEDPRNGFVHGGWADGYQDQVQAEFAARGMSAEGGLLFGRRTYEDVLHHWTEVAGPNPFAERLLRSPKYVVSRSAETRLRYAGSELLSGDATITVPQLLERVHLPLMVIGSGELVRTLHAARLVDEYVLLIHPIVLGSGTRLFGEAERVDLDLVTSVPTTTGVIIAQYTVRR